MEEQTTAFNVSETTIVEQPQVMVEKWLLVLLIVGCTSLVFLICFPIDFFLYRRRKRLARERKNITLPWYRPQTPTRAAQVHATLTVTKVAAEIDFEEMNATDRKAYRAQRGIMRFLSRIRRKSNRPKLQERLVDSKSEYSSDCRILTTPETTHKLTSSESKNKNFFRNHNQHNSNTRVQEYDEMQGEGRPTLRLGMFDSHEGTLEQSYKRTFSDACNNWSENDELVDREMNKLNYGAFEPLENMTSFTNEKTETCCFTIPVRGRNMVLVKSIDDLSESYTDFKNSNTNGSHQDIIVESKTDIGRSDPARGESDVNVSHTNTNSDKTQTDSEPDTEHDDKEGHSTSQDFNEVDEELEIDNYGALLHSNSDQCISYNSKHYNAPFKPRRKGNVVSPTNKNTSSDLDNFRIGEKRNTYLGNRRSVSLSTNLEEPSNIKRKKKKDSFLKKPCESMPELELYQKEKF